MGCRISVISFQYGEAMSSKRRSVTNRKSAEKAFAFGLSGIGMLVSPVVEVHALKRGATVGTAWSNVGRYIDRAAAKHLDERRKKETY